MSFRSIQQQVDNLFDRADHPNIANRDDGDYESLIAIRRLPISCKQSIAIIKDVLEAIVFVSTHLIIYKPCQVFKEHVILKNGRWGLCNIICYRDPNENQQFSPNRYYPIDYYALPDEESELLWSLGKMWFELLTDSRLPPIKALTQSDLQTVVTAGGISDIIIVGLLKEILTLDRKKQMSLNELIKHGLFEYEQRSRIYLHSIMPNLLQVQSMSELMKTSNFILEGQVFHNGGYNPFEEELFKRDFKQAIVIAELFEKVKKFIHINFEVAEKKDEVDFSCYLIDVYSYMRLHSFEIRMEQNQYLIVLFCDKPDYTRFVEKLLELQYTIDHKRKMKKFKEFQTRLPQLLESPKLMKKNDADLAYQYFKTYLTNYAKHYREQKMRNQIIDAKAYASLIQMMLVRTTNYVFANARKFVFGDFITNDTFDLSEVLKNIENCEDITQLKKLEKTIIELYFSQNGNHRRQ